MNRRRLLGELGAVGAAVSVAGCIADRDFGDESDTGDEDDSDGSSTDGGDDGNDTGGSETAPALESTEFDADQAVCGSENDASVAFEDAAVAVEGTIGASNPCHEAVAQSIEYDAEADELRVVVGTVSTDADSCATCLAEVPYTARAAFGGGLPGRVVVRHESEDGSETVADERP